MNNAFGRRESWIAVALCAVLLSNLAPSAHAQPKSEVDESPAIVGEYKNVAVVGVAKYEKLISDIGFLGSLSGKPEWGQMIEGGFSFVTQGKGPNAIDKTKAWGIIVQTDDSTLSPIGCLPVLKPKDLLDIAKGFGAQIKDGEGGVTEVILPSKKSVFVKVDAGMAFISLSPGSLSKLPASPQELLSQLVGDYVVAAHIAVKNVPEKHRNAAITAMQAGAQRGMKHMPDESEEEFTARQKMTEAQMKQVAQMVNEIDSIKFGWAIDSQQQKMFADVSFTALPGTQLAKRSAYVEPKTDFAGFYQPDAAATVTFAAQTDSRNLSEEDFAQFDASVQQMRNQVASELKRKIKDPETREAIEGAVGDWIDAFVETMKAGLVDGGGALTLSSDSLTAIAGFHTKDSAKVESGLKKLEAAAKKEPNFSGVKWNASEHKGIRFHTIAIPVPENEQKRRKVLGEEVNVAIGIGADAAYFAFGKSNLEAVTNAIDASAANKGKRVPPFELALSLGQIMDFASTQALDGPQQEVIEKVAEKLRNEGQGRDHIRAVAQIIPSGLKYHFEAEESVLKAIGTAAAATTEIRMRHRK